MMKKIAVALVLVLGMAGSASAQTVVTVTATVGEQCVAVSNGSFHFAIADTSVITSASSITNPKVQCTNGSVATITAASAGSPSPPLDCAIGAGFSGMITQTPPGTSTFIYNFTCGNGTVTGTGISAGDPSYDVNVVIDGSVGAGDASSASPGTYTDTLTLTISM